MKSGEWDVSYRIWSDPERVQKWTTAAVNCYKYVDVR
jgi:hypothetical protein